MKQKVWKCKYRFVVEFISGYFSKKLEDREVEFEDDMFLIGEDKTVAINKFALRNHFNNNSIPFWVRYDNRIPDNFSLMSKELEVFEVRETLDYLKDHMYADEFLEYCRNILYPAVEVTK